MQTPALFLSIGLLCGGLLPALGQSMVDPAGITAEAGSTFDFADPELFNVSNLLDDLTEEGNQDAHLGTHWIALEGTFTETVTFNLGGSYDLTNLDILNTSNTGWNDSETDTFTVATSTDGGGSFSAPGDAIALRDFTEGFQEVPLVASGVTHVQLVVTNEDADDQGTNDVRVGLNEVRFYQNLGADSDGDGMLDAWEIAHFGDLSRDGTEDEDEPAPDGLTNKVEHDKATDPRDADSDDDELTDGAEVNTHMTDPNDVDSDDDTLTDNVEVVVYMTNPNSGDSDGDSLGDADEVNVHNTDPNNSDTDEDFLSDGNEVNVFSTNPLVPDMIVDPATITVTAGSTYDFADPELFNASNLVDGLTAEGNRNTHLGTHWIALEGTFTETVTFDLGDFYNLTALQVLNTSNTSWNDSETDTFTVATSADGGASFSDPSEEIALRDYSEGFQTVPIDESGISHVRLVVTNEDADDQGTDDVRVGLNEVLFFLGEGEDPNLSIRSVVDIGIVQPDAGVQTVSIPVRNTGSEITLEIASVVLNQAGSTYQLVSFPESIAPRVASAIEVTLDPAQVRGLATGELVITSNDPSQPTFTTSLSASVPLASHLVAWYRMDETAGGLQDASGNGRHASAAGGVALGQSGLAGGNSVQFTPDPGGAAAAYVEVPDFPVLQSLSISLWAQATGDFPTGIGTLLSKVEGEGVGEAANSPYSLALFSAVDSTLGWIVSESPEDFGASVPSTSLAQPTHIVVVHEDANGAQEGATVTRLYLNGELADEVENPPGFADAIGRFQVGARASATGFNGLIDDVQIYNRVLTNEETRQLFENPGMAVGVAEPPVNGDRLPDLQDVEIGEAGTLSITIPNGITAEVEYSIDLMNWEVIANGQSGQFEDTDAGRLGAPKGFYRAKQ